MLLSQDDIEKVVAEIEAEESRRKQVVEATVEAPSRRVNFSLTAHPFKDELIMFGGEYHDGKKVHAILSLYFLFITQNFVIYFHFKETIAFSI